MNVRTKKISSWIIGIAVVAILVSSTIAISSSVPERNDLKAGEQVGEQAIVRGAPPDGESTVYEEIKEVGFYPQERRLETVIQIKRASGYSGAPEYVGFWVDWNNNSIFEISENAGLVNVHVPDPGSGNAWALPINYSAYRDVNPPFGVASGKVVKVRAILSWNTPPTGPNFIPTWGNRINGTIRIDSIR